MLYRKLPVGVEAIQYTGNNGMELKKWSDGAVYESPVAEPSEGNPTGEYVQIKTLEGVMTGIVGDYIIKGVKNEFYPCKRDIFEQTYSEISAELPFENAFGFLKHNPSYFMRLPHWSPDVRIKIWTPSSTDQQDKGMTAPFLYVESRFGRVPWKETMIELFSEKWEVGRD